MTPEQFAIFIDRNDKATNTAIEKHVNGKIRAIDAKIDGHIASFDRHMVEEANFREKIEPFMQGAAGMGMLWKGLVVLGGIALAWSEVKGVFHP